ncbi:MAG: M48 family metallopeptidase [Phycisphaeraceae bacterium]
MLHIVLIAILLLTFLGSPLGEADSPAWLGPAAGAGAVLLALGYAGLVRRTLASFGKTRAIRRLRHLDRATLAYQLAVVGLLVAAMSAGWLAWIRRAIGDLILIDELLAALPAFALLLWRWYAYYPVERRIREASLIRSLDHNDPVYPVWTRGQYLLAHARHHMGLILGPILPLLAWMEWLGRLAGAGGREAVLSPGTAGLLSFAGALTIFLFAPAMIVRLWDTEPLPEGEIRGTLTEMCRRAGVRVHDLLLWKSHGGIVNAAVMGLVAPLRYVLLSDGLLDQLDRRHVAAVMAHELGHVKKKHMPTLALVAVGSMGLLQLAGGLVLEFLQPAVRETFHGGTHATEAIVFAMLGLAWLGGFGWVSRRIEREADTFAVRTLAESPSEPPTPTEAGEQTSASSPPVIGEASARQMIDALQRVADLAHIDPRRRSWRHGSIAWRQQYLRGLIGQPLDRLPIDRTLRLIRFAGVATVIGVVALSAYLTR